MGPEGIILVNPPITTFQESLTHSALWSVICFNSKNSDLVLFMVLFSALPFDLHRSTSAPTSAYKSAPSASESSSQVSLQSYSSFRKGHIYFTEMWLLVLMFMTFADLDAHTSEPVKLDIMAAHCDIMFTFPNLIPSPGFASILSSTDCCWLKPRAPQLHKITNSNRLNRFHNIDSLLKKNIWPFAEISK